MKFLTFFLLSTPLLLGCGNNDTVPNKPIESSNNRTVTSKETATSCPDKIKRLVSSTNLQNSNSLYKAILEEGLPVTREELSVWVDRIDDSSTSIQLTFENEDERQVTVAWLRIHLLSVVIADITTDDDEVTYLSFDTTLLIDIQKNCVRK